MFFAAFLLLGAYFLYDIPASLHNSLKEYMDCNLITILWETDPDDFEIYFSGLFSVYAFANIFLPFLTGAIRD